MNRSEFQKQWKCGAAFAELGERHIKKKTKKQKTGSVLKASADRWTKEAEIAECSSAVELLVRLSLC